jgi:hypothetical protein
LDDLEPLRAFLKDSLNYALCLVTYKETLGGDGLPARKYFEIGM